MKAKFSSLSLHYLRVGELFTFLHQVLPFFKAYDAAGAKHQRLVGELSDTIAAMKSAIISGSLKTQTKTVNRGDTRRDKSLSRFQHYVQYFQLGDDDIEANAANLLLKAIKDAGDIYHMGVKGKTSAIHGINELFSSNSRYVEALALLKATAEWGKVWATQQTFEAAYGNRSQLVVEEKVDAAAYKLAKKARRQCSALFQLVESLYSVEEKKEYLEIIAKVNLEIEQTMAVVRTRRTLAAKKKEEATKKEDSQQVKSHIETP
jgi:hypothetical protein